MQLGRASSAAVLPVLDATLSLPQVEALCKKATEQAGNGQYVRVANYLCPGNYAVSGSTAAVEARRPPPPRARVPPCSPARPLWSPPASCRAARTLASRFPHRALSNSLPPSQIVEKIAKPEYKARMVVRLAVAGAFHTDFMAPAVEKLQAALAATPMKQPTIPVVSNVDGKPHSDPAVIKAILAKQVTSPVLWENTLQTLLDKGMAESYEIGPGKARAREGGGEMRCAVLPAVRFVTLLR